MKVTGNDPFVQWDPYAKAVAKQEDRRTQEGEGKGEGACGGDHVDLSPESKAMGRLLERVQQLPDVREVRVARLKEQIAQGNYRADPQKIAQAILEEALEMEFSGDEGGEREE